ncbi:MAG: hypothetical protein QOJ90_1890 [Actinomycetota bacterium]|jgi:hypothetical protein|nr:hypothetical protein [Actinomycetota bacterium]
MTRPELLEAGRPDSPGPRLPFRLPPAALRVGSWAIALTVVVTVVASHRSAPPPPLTVAAAADADPDAMLRWMALEQRNASIRAVPSPYRDAAGLVSTMRGGRTPANFFLALAYARTQYGARLVGRSGGGIANYVYVGPVQWQPSDFAKYADPMHRNSEQILDSFLAVETELHSGPAPDFSDGAFEPATLLGLDTREAQSLADIYDILDGAGVREGLPS